MASGGGNNGGRGGRGQKRKYSDDPEDLSYCAPGAIDIRASSSGSIKGFEQSDSDTSQRTRLVTNRWLMTIHLNRPGGKGKCYKLQRN